MGGDHAGGLAIAIGVAMVVMVALPAVVGGVAGALAGGLVGRAAGSWRGGLALVAGAAGMAFGGAAGTLAVFATFYEGTFDPPPRLVLAVPAGYSRETVVVLEDARSDTTLRWEGADLPFLAPEAMLTVPPSGVLRVRSLATLDWVDACTSEGRCSVGFSSGPAAPGLDATRMVVFSFAAYPGQEPDLELMSPEDVARVLRAREAER